VLRGFEGSLNGAGAATDFARDAQQAEFLGRNS